MVSIDPNGHDCKAEWFDGMGVLMILIMMGLVISWAMLTR